MIPNNFPLSTIAHITEGYTGGNVFNFFKSFY